MTRTTSHRFGPGYTENLRVSVWTVPGSNGLRKKARVQGFVRVACSVDYALADVDETFDVWTSDLVRNDADAALVFRAQRNDDDGRAAAEALAVQGAEWALEGWTDPTDVEDEEVEVVA